MVSSMKTHDEHGNMIDDESINVFISALDTLPKDEWRARTLAFESLIEAMPGPGSTPSYVGSGIVPWYKSYTALRRLCNPIASLLLNARSTVVKHTCQHLAFLVQRVRDANPVNADTPKYLLKDLLPTILALHAQTVNVIRGYALEMMTIIIPLCRFKSGLPVLLERLRKDKSRDVREACVRYLKLIVKHWSAQGDESPMDQDYLTPNICMHIGNGLARALMDQGQGVRMEARNAFELYRSRYPDLWGKIVNKKDGILSKDARLKKSVMNAAARKDNSDGNDDVHDYYPSYDEGEDYDAKTMKSEGSKGSLNSWNSSTSFMSKNSKAGFRATVRSASATRGLRGPSMRTNNGNLPPASKRPTPVQRSTSNGNGTGRRKPSGAMSPVPTPAPPVPDAVSLKAGTSAGSPLSSLGHAAADDDGGSMGKKPSENYLISNQLLAAHKNYIDELMESLRTEMNTVRDFETVLVQSQSNPNNAGLYGPTEDEVLRYYEAVYSYLDKGAENSVKLRNEMERISKTEFQS